MHCDVTFQQHHVTMNLIEKIILIHSLKDIKLRSFEIKFKKKEQGNNGIKNYLIK